MDSSSIAFELLPQNRCNVCQLVDGFGSMKIALFCEGL